MAAPDSDLKYTTDPPGHPEGVPGLDGPICLITATGDDPRAVGCP